MEIFKEYLLSIVDETKRAKLEAILLWIKERFPNLEPRLAWNQPMFTDHGTYIIGLSVSKGHIAVSPEQAGIEKFAEAIKKSGYTYSKMIFRIKWTDPVDYSLLERMIIYNLEDKANTNTFWR